MHFRIIEITLFMLIVYVDCIPRQIRSVEDNTWDTDTQNLTTEDSRSSFKSKLSLSAVRSTDKPNGSGDSNSAEQLENNKKINKKDSAAAPPVAASTNNPEETTARVINGDNISTSETSSAQTVSTTETSTVTSSTILTKTEPYIQTTVVKKEKEATAREESTPQEKLKEVSTSALSKTTAAGSSINRDKKKSEYDTTQSTITTPLQQTMRAAVFANYPIDSKNELIINSTEIPDDNVDKETTRSSITTNGKKPSNTDPAPVGSLGNDDENLTAWQKFVKMLSDNYILIVIVISGVIIILIVTIAIVLGVKKSRKENYELSKNGGGAQIMDDTSRPADNSGAVLNMATLYSRSGDKNQKDQELPYMDEKGD